MTKRATVDRNQTTLTFTSHPQSPMIRSGQPVLPQICPKTKTKACHPGLPTYLSGLDKTQ